MAIESRHVILNRNVLKNTASNYLGKLIVMGTGFVLTPFILSRLDDTMYGLWVLVGSTVAYGSLFDLGISSAVVKYVAEYHAKGEFDRARRLIATALAVYTFLGLAIFAVCALLAPFFPRLFHLPVEQHPIAVSLVMVSGLGMGLSIPGATAPAVLRGLQRFDLLNLVSTAGMLLYAFGVLVVLLAGGGALELVAVGIIVNVATQAPYIYLIRKTAPELRFSFRGAGLDVARTITRFSWTLFLLNLNGYLETKTDEMVVGASLPVSVVTPYNIARRLSILPQTFAEQFLALLLPLASVLDAKSDRAQLRSLYMVSTRLTLAFVVPFAVLVGVWAESILHWWVGDAFVQYAYLVLILVVASVVDMSTWPAGLVLQGMARHRWLAIMSTSSGIMNLVLSVALVRVYGLAGVAIGTLIPTVLVCMGLVLPYAMRLLKVGPKDAFGKMFSPALLPAIPMLIWMLLCREIAGANSIPSFVLGGGTGLLFYALGFLAQKVNSAERQAFRELTLGALDDVRAYVGMR